MKKTGKPIDTFDIYRTDVKTYEEATHTSFAANPSESIFKYNLYALDKPIIVDVTLFGISEFFRQAFNALKPKIKQQVTPKATQQVSNIQQQTTPPTAPWTYTFDYKDCHVSLSKTIYDTIVGNIEPAGDLYTAANQLTEEANQLVAYAAMLFCGYIDAATDFKESIYVGGDSGNTLGWHKKDDEDDLTFARRCAKKSSRCMKPRYGRSRGR